MRVKYKHLPNDIRTHYNLDSTVTNNDHICIKFKKGIPSPKKSSKLAYDHLRASLEPYRYEPIPATVGLWRYKTRILVLNMGYNKTMETYAIQ